MLGNVLERAGWEVEREYYLNDAGNQIAELGESVKGTGTSYTGPYVAELRKHLDTGPDGATVGREAAKHLRQFKFRPFAARCSRCWFWNEGDND